MTTRGMERWEPLLDQEGNVIARYCPRHRILVIKRRGEEHRFHLVLYDQPNVLDKTEQACYDDPVSHIHADKPR